MPAPSWPGSRCAAMSLPSPSKPSSGARRLLLAGADLPVGSRGAGHSSYARTLLSELAARFGMDCPSAQWSARGQGKPFHPDLPPGWFANISHKQGRVIVGLAEERFGLDLECATQRHATRLDALIDMLPEPHIRQWIRGHDHPQTAFYQAWTLYESLFKLAGHTDSPAQNVFSLRLQSLDKPGREPMVWQGGDWTLAIVSDAGLELSPDPALLFPELRRVPIAIRSLTQK